VPNALSITVAIPTYQRESVLLNTLSALLALEQAAAEILVLDQTRTHEPETNRQLTSWHQANSIRWLRLEHPSIPAAMNHGLVEARESFVLFLDDDIRPDADLITAHLSAHQQADLVAGLVLQPGEQALPLKIGERFRFNSTEPAWIGEFIGCNFSVKRDVALKLGGFDENFTGAAYRFEAEFAHRYTASYGPIRFEPAARIHHLQVPSGGTRAHGHHLRTVKAAHSVGAYYYLLRTREPNWFWKMTLRPLRSIRTRYHMRRPWWIPLTLLAEIRGFIKAIFLTCKGPKFVNITRTLNADD
jgi:GT2 family glycosyltransferase